MNRSGGGYEVTINGQPTKDVPYSAGNAAPTSTTVQLLPGSYVVAVRAYAALDPQGGSDRNFSTPMQLTLTVR